MKYRNENKIDTHRRGREKEKQRIHEKSKRKVGCRVRIWNNQYAKIRDNAARFKKEP